MNYRKYIPALLLPLLLLSACGGFRLTDSSAVRAEARRLAEVQMGKLGEHVTALERRQITGLLEQLLALRQTGAIAEDWARAETEGQMVSRLNQIYEDCTRRYLGEPDSWSADEEKMETLAEYTVAAGGALEHTQGEDAYRELWERVSAMLPPGSLDAFDRFTVFTDGEKEILAYVAPADDEGVRWELGVDPADTEDEAYFAETVFHEYCHYLTLNSRQAVYEESPSCRGCYTEEGMTAQPDSYLTAFYRAFWADYLEDRLAAPESSGFYLRHADDFLTSYAATNPSEDIAESFAYFILYEKGEGEGLSAQKQNFFYAYPELEAFRAQARARLGL